MKNDLSQGDLSSYLQSKTIDRYDSSRRMNKSTIVSSYRQGTMQADNSKFDQFLTILLQSKLKREEVKLDILRYVQTMETNYTDRVTHLQKSLEKAHKSIVQERTRNVDRLMERSELESLFSEAIEETKRRLVHRRLTSELNSNSARKMHQTRTPEDLDDALHKLTELAKDKVKVEEFSANDKASLLEIFVQNEEVWLKMHDVIFPNLVRQKNQAQSELGNQIKGHKSPARSDLTLDVKSST